MSDALDARLERVAALGEPVRRALYRFVVSQPEPVSREQASGEVGVAHHVAKFHLDRLVEHGLLEAGYQRPPGRVGPGAGRPAKVYHQAGDDLAVSLPERRYDLAGHVLVRAAAAAQRDGTPMREAIERVASATGRAIGEAGLTDLTGLTGPTEARRERRPRRNEPRERVAGVLEEYGYAPRDDGEAIALSNCPFHALAQEETDLVCGMNRDLIAGVLEGLGLSKLCARLDPAPGRCCVRIDRR